MSNTILLSRFQYCHIQDNNTGALALHEGPGRIQPESHQTLVEAVKEKIRLYDGQFAVILNPFDSETGDIREGEREVRIGPAIFPLRPGEKIKDGVQDEFVLTDDDGLLLRTEKDVADPRDTQHILPPGTELLLRGPRKYIPHKDITVKEKRRLISLAEAEGVYVQNNDTGVVRLVRGPADFFLEHNECLWKKELTLEEWEALGYVPPEHAGNDSRILAATPRPRKSNSDAVVIDLEDKEVVYLYEGDRVRVEFGPQVVFLGPHERPKVLYLSGGLPVRPNVLRIAKLALGPDFIHDRLNVRTRDNATLQLDVTYHWRFRSDAHVTVRLFALKDFVGFAAQTLSSEIREEAAKHNFEKFHSEAAVLVKTAIFGEHAVRVFTENGLEVFGVDVCGITPEDEEIARKLSDAIKTNVDIYTRRVQEEAQLESERRLIDGRATNERARKQLLKLQAENARFEAVQKARSASEAAAVSAQSQADTIKIVKAAEREAEVALLAETARTLNGEGGKAYIELERARVLKDTDKVIVPSDTRLYLGPNGAPFAE